MSKKKTSLSPYQAYVEQYKKNVNNIAKYDNPVTAEAVGSDIMTEADFNASLKKYRVDWQLQHPNRHGESADRIAKWVANRETKDRSYKQAQNIKRVAKELGWDLTTNEIQFGSSHVVEFWDFYVTQIEGGLITKEIWGSP